MPRIKTGHLMGLLEERGGVDEGVVAGVPAHAGDPELGVLARHLPPVALADQPGRPHEPQDAPEVEARGVKHVLVEVLEMSVGRSVAKTQHVILVHEPKAVEAFAFMRREAGWVMIRWDASEVLDGPAAAMLLANPAATFETPDEALELMELFWPMTNERADRLEAEIMARTADANEARSLQHLRALLGTEEDDDASS